MKSPGTLQSIALGILIQAFAMGMPPTYAQQNTQTPVKPYSDKYTTQKDAEIRARELGCSGAYRNGAFWMPCGNYMMYRNCWDRYYQK